MNTTELRDLFRSEFSDAAAPYLIPDTSVYAYLDDAQNMFCRLTEGIEDSRTTAVTRLSVVPGTEWYALSPLILKVRKASRTDTGRAVAMVNAEKADALGIRFDGRSGVLDTLVAGLEKHAVRAWPIPNETVTVELATFRLPLAAITTSGQTLEIDIQHHQRLLLWVKHRAYGNQDTEIRDDKKALEYEQRFRAYCAQALTEQERARRVIGTVMYGGY